MQKVSGKEISQSLIEELKTKPIPQKILAAILVGENKASISFLKQKQKIGESLGIDFRIYNFSDSLTKDDLREKVERLVNQKSVGGAIIQLPLPEGMDRYYILNVIPKGKDIDVLGERSVGASYSLRNLIFPPAVEAVKEICERQKFDLKDKDVVVLGAGIVIGKPIALWAIHETNKLSVIRSGGDLGKLETMDLVISGVGKPGLINPILLKNGASVIDFGYGEKEGKISGDLDTSDEKNLSHLNFYTPTPGGIGPIVVAKLFQNFYKLNS